MAQPDEKVLIIAKAIADLVDLEKTKSGLRDPQVMIDEMKESNQRLDTAISKVNTLEELLTGGGEILFDVFVKAAIAYVKGAGPAGLVEAALTGAIDITEFLSGE